MAYVPALIAAYGAIKQGHDASNASLVNAQIQRNESNVAVDNANQQENQVRRNSREALARQTAAFGASGTGYTGSNAGVLDESAYNQEMDALNTRYKGALAGYGYAQQGSIDQSTAGTQNAQGGLTAAGQLLKGFSSSYSLYNPSGTPVVAAS